MANSLITRCPKCSTAFRVDDEILNSAKGKVRCGQCFNIFSVHDPKAQHTPEPKKAFKKTPEPAATQKESVQTQANQPSSATSENSTTPETSYQERLRSAKRQAMEASLNDDDDNDDDLAPWEKEVAEVERALQETSRNIQSNKLKQPPKKPASARSFAEQETTPDTSKIDNQLLSINNTEDKESNTDYLATLQTLAQSASKQSRPSQLKKQQKSLDQLSAKESLAPLLEDEDTQIKLKKSHPWLWLFSSLLGLTLLSWQVAIHYFDEGSRSPNFRPIYQIICSYSKCKLPRFEHIESITLEHVRIQSHPTTPNALVVNAIINNTSRFSQPMPKIALEFFDLNGAPVAARLFEPNAYLHKDFLDITYMPPNTPIHLVIPIQDPGARAVTHQLKAFPTDTRSY